MITRLGSRILLTVCPTSLIIHVLPTFDSRIFQNVAMFVVFRYNTVYPYCGSSIPGDEVFGLCSEIGVHIGWRKSAYHYR